MFEVGFWELALLFALGLVVLGPEKLPKVASQLGRYVGQARRMARSLTTQIRDEIEAEERRIAGDEESEATSSAHAEPPTYHRPGMDDLIPKSPPEDVHRDVANESATEADAGTPDVSASPR